MNPSSAVSASSHVSRVIDDESKVLKKSQSTLHLVFRESVETGNESSRKAKDSSRIGRVTRKNGDVKKIYIEMLKDLLNEENDVCPFICTLQNQFAKFIQEDKKPLIHAACDLWRMCSKLGIQYQDGEVVRDVLERHPHAYDDEVPEDRVDLNRRFLLLLSCFQKRGITLPEFVDWKGVEDVSRWVEKDLQIESSHPLARFIRSCSQERYNGVHIENAVLTNYGLTPDATPPPPILASVQSKRLSSTRLFYDDGRHDELLTIPIQVKDRNSHSELCIIDWKLRFCYDKECFLIKVHSSL